MMSPEAAFGRLIQSLLTTTPEPGSVDAGLAAASNSVLAPPKEDESDPDLHSGAHWRKIADDKGWSNSVSLEDLSADFKPNVESFLKALDAAKSANANAKLVYVIGTTRRNKVRAWLMHWAWEIKEGKLPPSSDEHNTRIIWSHDTPEKTKAAALAMTQAFGMKYIAALDSLHISGNAIDLTITWEADFELRDADDNPHPITGEPRHAGREVNGVVEIGNTEVHAVGATYEVKKLTSDPPHWSTTGN